MGQTSKCDEENANKDETRQRRGHGCPETHMKIWGKVGPICLPFGEAMHRVFI